MPVRLLQVLELGRASGRAAGRPDCDSGSSSSSRRGSKTIARASATRCCWPPESCVAGRCAQPVQARPARASRSTFSAMIAARRAAHAQRVGDVVEDRHVRPDRVALEHHAHVALLGGHEHVALGRADQARRRARLRRRPAPRARRSCAAWWSCRSRSGRAAPAARRGATSKLTSSTARTLRSSAARRRTANSLTTPRTLTARAPGPDSPGCTNRCAATYPDAGEHVNHAT